MKTTIHFGHSFIQKVKGEEAGGQEGSCVCWEIQQHYMYTPVEEFQTLQCKHFSGFSQKSLKAIIGGLTKAMKKK